MAVGRKYCEKGDVQKRSGEEVEQIGRKVSKEEA